MAQKSELLIPAMEEFIIQLGYNVPPEGPVEAQTGLWTGRDQGASEYVSKRSANQTKSNQRRCTDVASFVDSVSTSCVPCKMPRSPTLVR